jgi:DNA replication and repair protein RecF
MEARLCSTGEQKALLLDEVAAHLDAARRAALMEELLELGSQTWMTGTDRHLFEAASGEIEVFEVADGRVSPSVRQEQETA